MRPQDFLRVLLICVCMYGISAELHAEESQRVDTRHEDVPQHMTIAEVYREFMGDSIQGYSSRDVNLNEQAYQAIDRYVSDKAENKIQYIVVPVQENSPYFDRIGRVLSAQWVAQALMRGLDANVMSPEAVTSLFRAKRVINVDQIVELSKRLDAQVIFLFLDSDKYITEKKSIDLTWVLTGPEGDVIRKTNRKIENPVLETPLELQVKEIAQACLEELLELDLAHQGDNKDNNPLSENFIRDFNDLNVLNESKMAQAAYLQILGFMIPEMFEHERDGYFQRSLLVLNEVSDSVKFHRVLSARAWFHLHRKPVSMQLLGDEEEASARAALAYQNGNYPELKSAIQDIDNPIMKLLSIYELNELRIAYQKNDNNEKDLNEFGEIWRKFIGYMLRDSDEWFSPNNISYFSEISGLFEDFDSQFKKSLESVMVSGDMNISDGGGRILQEIMIHERHGKGERGCCEGLMLSIDDMDIWNLYSLNGYANLLRKLNKLVNLQGAYDSAYEYAQKIEPVVDTLPRFSRLYAETCEGLAKKRPGKERDFYIDKASQLIGKVYEQSVGLDTDAIKAALLQDRFYYEYNKKGVVDGLRLSKLENVDIPTSYVVFSKYALSSGSYVALPYVNSNFGVFKFTVFGKKWSDDKISEYLTGHYDGHPDKVPYMAKRLESKGKYQDAIKVLLQEIDASGGGWDAYLALGRLQLMESDYTEAKSTFMKYPGFKSMKSDNAVALSSEAYTAGNLLFWLGRYDEFKYFYRICANLATGANHDYASKQRLAMVERDFSVAIENAYKRGTRYNSRYGYRDFLVMLHLIGEHAQADAGFSALVTRYQEPPVWTAQLIGRRIQGQKYSDVARMAKEYYDNALTDNQRTQAIRYLFLETVTDRMPSDSEYDGFPDVPVVEESVIRGGSTLLQKLMVESKGKDAMDCKATPGGCAKSNDSLIDPKSNMYKNNLLAYTQVKREDYQRAYESYLQIDKLSPLFSYTYKYDKDSLSAKKTVVSVFLPYFVEAATQVHEDAMLRKLADTLGKEPVEVNSKFDVDLSLAIIYGYFGEYDKSFHHLKYAFNERPHTKWRPIYSWYQLTEISEWMYARYGDRRYLDLALDWAKRYQVIQPQFAWAYAFEAAYSNVAEDRVKAAAFAEYLDGDSLWLKSVPEEITKQTEAWWKQNNPFVIKQDTAPQEKSALYPIEERVDALSWVVELISGQGEPASLAAVF